MKIIVLLAILPLSYQDITENQLSFCTGNDNGDIWKYDLTPLGKVDRPFQTHDNKWLYHIALCGTTNIDLDTKNSSFKGDAIVQTNKDENHVVGTQIISRTGGEYFVVLILGKGDTYNNHCGQSQRKAQIIFVCDPNAGLGTPNILDEANSKDEFCFYMFEWPTSLVCPSNAKGSVGKGMSVFKLLLIELVVIVVVYFILGVGYRRYVVGARGYEQIPNLAFWKSCKEGMQATVDKCRGQGSGIGGVRSDNITTTGGALNINNDDDERLIM